MKHTSLLLAVLALVVLSQAAFAEAPQPVAPDEPAGTLQSTDPPADPPAPVSQEEILPPAEDDVFQSIPEPSPAGICTGAKCAQHVCACNFECSGCYAVITCYPDYLCVCC